MGVKPHGRVIKFRLRNTNYVKECAYGDQPQQTRTKDQPSPVKHSGSNVHPGESQTRTDIDKAIDHELTKGRFRSDDLADHMFGSQVSTDVARDILEEFIANETVKVFEKSSPQTSYVCLNADSDSAKIALDVAFKDAIAHGCLLPDSAKPEKTAKNSSYKWEWSHFPSSSNSCEDKLVDFLNAIADKARTGEVAKSRLGESQCKAKNRFAAPKDKHHPIPLSYEADAEDMRPDFMILPIEAFGGEDLEQVDETYFNFTALLAVGESKSSNFRDGLNQVQRYARGIKRAQPWSRFVVAMTVAHGKAALLRGDGSGTERLELGLQDGRGCIEFIRILLGLALAEKEDLGKNPAVDLGEEEQDCDVTKPIKTAGSTGKTASSHLQFSRDVPSRRDASRPTTRSQSRVSTSKRSHSQVDDVGDAAPDDSSAIKRAKNVVRCRVFIPKLAYGYQCIGILFTAGSIRGRSTSVFVVVDSDDETMFRALKTSWQDVAREEEQYAVSDGLSGLTHTNVVVPFKTFKAEWKDGDDTTLEAIRTFYDDQLEQVPVENRALTISISELKRQVKYFWGSHDFVRGLRGALLGHQYLCRIGILHRDISENNIVLARHPDEKEHGYLIDLDMAILEPAASKQPLDSNMSSKAVLASILQPPSPVSTNCGLFKAHRTGTTPYMSINVLKGDGHSKYDDVESFLYVLLLFFLSYAGPLSKAELCAADERGFTHIVGSGVLPHMTSWPKMFQSWSNSSRLADIARFKSGALHGESAPKELVDEISKDIKNRWSDQDFSILHLLFDSWKLFADSRRNRSGTYVAHEQFIGLLDGWLVEYEADEEKYSNCPFPKAPA